MRSHIALIENTIADQKIAGVRFEISGRLNGVLRAQRKVMIYGHQYQQHIGSVIDYSEDQIITKYGALGLKTQCMKESIKQAPYRTLRATA